MLTQTPITIGTLVHMAKNAGWKPKYLNQSEGLTRPKGRLKPIAWSELGSLPKRDYLIKGLLDARSMSTVFGESNCGKTFVALDMAAHIALGRNWRGMKVNKGAVVYIAAEGGMGLTDRLTAFHKHYDLQGYPPLLLIPAGVDLCNSHHDAKELIEEIQGIENVGLVVVDTLSRAMSGGNENSPDDMGAFIKNCDRIREETKAHVMIIHHSGKDSSKGARGHSALKAAVDTEIEVKKTNDNSIVAEITKQRDGVTGIKYGFILSPVTLGKDEDGMFQTSCVALPSEDALLKKGKELKGKKKKIFQCLQKFIVENGTPFIPKIGTTVNAVICKDFRKSLMNENLSSSDKPDNIRRTIMQALNNLISEGFISVSSDYIWIPDKPDNSEKSLSSNRTDRTSL